MDSSLFKGDSLKVNSSPVKKIVTALKPAPYSKGRDAPVVQSVGEDEPSDYELLRLSNIERNKSMMKDLGLEEKMIIKSSNRTPKRCKEAEDAERAEPRRSKRVVGGPVDYTKEHVNTFGEEIDLQIERQEASKADERPQRKREERPQRKREEVLVDLAKAAEEARLAMHALRAAVNPAALDREGELAWRRIAEERWGLRVELANPTSWETYVLSRMPVKVPKSPSGLLQERYADCPWRLLIACNLMSRVSSAETKKRCIEGFFAAFPTPR
jgi:hypothetical protein